MSVLDGASVFVAGHRGLVGSALVRRLRTMNVGSLLTPGSDELDLRRADDVERWFQKYCPDFVFLVAGRVGGIQANSTFPVDFLHDNMAMHMSVFPAAHRSGVKKLLYLGSSCIYPRDAPQPISESALLTGPLEPTNEWYALAKISGIKLCQAFRQQYGSNFISAMPTNLYGPEDNFDLASGHVLPALMRKFHEARSTPGSTVEIWGTGTPRREFLHVDDLAEACIHLINHYDHPDPINVGTGVDLSIRELAETLQRIVNPESALAFRSEKPDGTPRKVLDVSRIRALGWSARIDLGHGIESTYKWLAGRLASAQEVRGWNID